MLEELEKQFHKDENILRLNETLVSSFAKNIRELIIFDYIKPNYTKEELNDLYNLVEKEFESILEETKLNNNNTKELFLSKIPNIRKRLNTTIDAIYEGDPAALNKQQIVLNYPGFEAILYYRVAHELYILGLSFVARFISELTHHSTGIDINPGATIGDFFFIDHGTGIVIGETSVIGDHVKIYQGVTLGALSLSKGRSLQGTRRHPTVEDYVTIYSNAAIFGGDTIIGHHSTIGGDVYLTHSVEPYSIVLQTDKNLIITKKEIK